MKNFTHHGGKVISGFECRAAFAPRRVARAVNDLDDFARGDTRPPRANIALDVISRGKHLAQDAAAKQANKTNVKMRNAGKRLQAVNPTESERERAGEETKVYRSGTVKFSISAT